MKIVKRIVHKKGQIQLSFGMIFSIIIIIATIAVAFYAISFFMGLQKCVNVGYLYENLNKKVDDAWKIGVSKDVFSADIPSGIDSVCFGNLTQGSAGGESGQILNELKDEPYLFRSNANVFLYPQESACETSLAYYKLSHMKTDSFFCKDAANGKISINLEKGVYDALVKVSP